MRDILLKATDIAALAGGAYALYASTKFSWDLYNKFSFANHPELPITRRAERAYFESFSFFKGLLSPSAWRFWMMRQDEKWGKPIFNFLLTAFPVVYTLIPYVGPIDIKLFCALFTCTPFMSYMYMMYMSSYLPVAMSLTSMLTKSPMYQSLFFTALPVLVCNILQYAPVLDYCIEIRKKVVVEADATLGQVGLPDSNVSIEAIAHKISNTDIQAKELSYLNTERNNLNARLNESRKNQEKTSIFKHFFNYDAIINRIITYEKALSHD